MTKLNTTRKKTIRNGSVSLGFSTDSDSQLSSWRKMAEIYQSDLISAWFLDTYLLKDLQKQYKTVSWLQYLEKSDGKSGTTEQPRISVLT